MASQPFGQFDESQWTEAQIERYGPMLGGENLRRFLGFRTPAAFHKARSLGLVGVAIFSLPGRQGMFALTSEACTWVIEQRNTSQKASGDDVSALSRTGGVS